MNESRVYRLATSVPWAILEDDLENILSIASRENLNIALAMEIAEKRKENFLAGLQGVERLKGTRSVLVNSNGVAVLPIYGSLFRRADMMSAISGAVTTETLETDFLAAYESNQVKTILADIDSPGGEVGFTQELSNTIRSYSGGKKRIEAFSAGTMASAAFWIGSAFEKVNITPTAMVGSVGVVATFVDTKELDKKLGVKRIEIVSSFAADKRADPSEPAGKKKIQALVNSIGEVFAADVAENFGISIDQVKGWNGGLMIGQEAVDAGMAHGLVYRSALMDDMGASSKSQGRVPITLSSTPKASDDANPQVAEQIDVAATDIEPVVSPEPSANPLLDASANDDNSATIPSNQEDDMSTEVKEKEGALATIASALGLSGMIKSDNPIVVAPQGKSDREKALEAKAAEQFLAGATSKIVPAANDQLRGLYLAAQEFGIEDKVEAFVAAMPQHNLTGDVIPPTQASKVAEEPESDEDKQLAQTRKNAEAYAAESNGQAAA